MRPQVRFRSVQMPQTRYGAFLLAVSFCAGCADLTRPPPQRMSGVTPQPVAAATPTAPAPVPVIPPRAEPPAVEAVNPSGTAAPAADQIRASHILVAYRGATRAKPTVTRSKDEARELATRIGEDARKPGTDFAQLARSVSDGPSGIEGGELPAFGRRQMVKPFADAAFGLQPGEISGVVETNFGFHIIKRTE
jgi:parvulin-like peptidyl-prolyl isomerase